VVIASSVLFSSFGEGISFGVGTVPARGRGVCGVVFLNAAGRVCEAPSCYRNIAPDLLISLFFSYPMTTIFKQVFSFFSSRTSSYLYRPEIFLRSRTNSISFLYEQGIPLSFTLSLTRYRRPPLPAVPSILPVLWVSIHQGVSAPTFPDKDPLLSPL